MRRPVILAIAIILALFLPTLINYGLTIQPVKAQQSTETFTDDFSTDSGAWQYFGSAHRDPTNQSLVLTDTSNEQAGVAFLKAPIQGSFTANFRFKAGEGNQGDGFTMFFYKQKYPSTVDYNDSFGVNGVSGGRLGFNSLSIIPGYGIEFDGWQNIPWDFQQVAGGQQNPQGDPSPNHIALIEDSTGNHLAYANDTRATDKRATDNNWHQVSIEVQESSVSVSVDQGLVLQWSGELNNTFDGFGFSGANGQVGSNWHIIDDFSITTHNLQKPSLTTSCISSISQTSLNVKINGYLTFNGAGISEAPILIFYSITGGESWQDLTLVHTDSDGSYSALWFPSATGDYMLKAVYEGNENYLGTSNIINFSIVPCTDQNVFSITSNSTLSELSFNSDNKELSFSVSGDNGTTGYVNVYIPKSLINDISGLKVYLDNSQIQYTSQFQGDGWLLYFTYHHSTHSVAINLSSQRSTSTAQPSTLTLDWVKIAILVFMGIITAIVVVVAFVYLGRKKR
jgi:hypothetical protein